MRRTKFKTKPRNHYTALLSFNKSDGWWTATCAEVPAAISQGRTTAEAQENLADALALVLSVQREESLREAGTKVKTATIRVAVG